MKYVMLVLIMGIAVCCRENEPDGAITSEATLRWMGDPAVDGCGLWLEVDTTRYFASSQQHSFITFLEADRGSIDVVVRYVVEGDSTQVSWGCILRNAEILQVTRR